jgi:hypothetical protein
VEELEDAEVLIVQAPVELLDERAVCALHARKYPGLAGLAD